MLEAAEIRREAARDGWRPEAFEKVARLLDLLVALRAHPYLRPRLALKGGTALNLFVLDAPRLSVDIDLNVVGAATRDAMLAERPRLEQAVAAVCGRTGLQVRRVAAEHAGGKWRVSYTSAFGRPASLEIDLNFLLRLPLWPVQVRASRPVGSLMARDVRVVDVHELAGGKLAALFDRAAPRDLFDAVELLQAGVLDERRLRVAFVVYGGTSRRDWRSVAADEIDADAVDIQRTLLPVLRADLAPRPEETGEWTAGLVTRCRRLLDVVLPLTDHEREFLTRLYERGEIVPALLTSDAELRDVILRHPALLWKAENVRRHVGATGGEPEPLDRSRAAEE